MVKQVYDINYLPPGWVTDPTLIKSVPPEHHPHTMKRLDENPEKYAICIYTGAIYNLQKQKFLSTNTLTRDGYVQNEVAIPFDPLSDTPQKTKWLRPSRLVCRAVFGPCPRKNDAAHLDANKQNNHWSNLIWQPRSENVKEMISRRGGFKGLNNPKAKNRWTSEDDIFDVCLSVWGASKNDDIGKIIECLSIFYAVTPKTIRNIASFKSHRDIVIECAKTYGYHHLIPADTSPGTAKPV